MANMTRAERVRRADPNRHFLTHLAVMPAWHKAVIALAMLLGIAGLTGHLMAKSGNDTAHAQTSSASKSTGDSVASQQQLTKYSPIAMTIGVAVLAGFTFGWFFRAFLAPAVVCAVLIAGGIGALAHFGYVHPEAWLPHANAKGGGSNDPNSASWLTQYAMHLKNLVMGHVATTSTGVVAACLGFRRW
jgi:hypothetical protein